MAQTITRGTSCRLVFRIKDVPVDELGDPQVAIEQDLAFVTPYNIGYDTDTNSLYADFLPQDTIQLVDGWVTRVQLAFVGDFATVIEFPVHYIEVRPSIFGVFQETEFELVDTSDEEEESENPEE